MHDLVASTSAKSTNAGPSVLQSTAALRTFKWRKPASSSLHNCTARIGWQCSHCWKRTKTNGISGIIQFRYAFINVINNQIWYTPATLDKDSGRKLIEKKTRRLILKRAIWCPFPALVGRLANYTALARLLHLTMASRVATIADNAFQVDVTRARAAWLLDNPFLFIHSIGVLQGT